MGGPRAVGKTAAEATKLFEDAKALEEAGTAHEEYNSRLNLFDLAKWPQDLVNQIDAEDDEHA